ncbi:hypothetical protein F4782DRAFT_532776 [Xylaria castorea]|nr:hypothetical protein F4782DRAFT_532776 [Xylaria castorea]
MADPLAWLKLGPRSRTPSTPLSTSSPECKAARERQLSDLRRPGSSRMSSHVTQAETGLESFSVDDTDDNATSLFVRNQDRIWYNPSLDQMVEALQVLLMTRGVLEPIPLEYNSYILHLIEGFAKARANIRKAEGAYQELKQSLEQNLEQFRLVADDWLERESQYRAEVKRLEVLLSKSSRNGLEAVALARANSVIDRNVPKRRGFLSRLNELKRDHLDGSARPPVPMTPKILDNDNDFLISKKFRKQDATAGASTTVSRERRAGLQGAANTKSPTTSSRWQDAVIKAPTTGPLERPTFWSGEALQPGPEGTKGGQGGFYDPLATPIYREHHGPLEAQSPTKVQARGEVLIGPSNPGICYRRDTSDIPTVTESNVTLTTRTAHRHERDNSGFSFEPGDDCVPLLGSPAEGYGGLDTGSCGQTPPCPSYSTHSTLESVATEECRRRGSVHSLFNGLISAKERRPIRGNDSLAVHHPLGASPTVVQSSARKPVRRSRDSGGNRKTTIKSSPSQSSRCHDSPVAASNGGQEAPEKQQIETEARIAATLALANALGSNKQKK